MNWLRLYVDVLEDRRFHDMPAELYRRWTFLLMLTRKYGGRLPSVPDIAWSLRISQDDAAGTVGELLALDLIDQTPDGLCPHNWHGRQYDSDNSTPRVRRHRDRQRNAPPIDESNVSRNVTATPNGTDQIQNRTESLPSGSVAAAPAPPTSPALEKPKPTKPKEQSSKSGWIEQHPCFGPLVAHFGRPGGKEWSLWGLELSTLMDKTEGMEPDAVAKEIPRRLKQWSRVMGADSNGTPILLTISGFVKHWHQLAPGGSPNGSTPHQSSTPYTPDPELKALVRQRQAEDRERARAAMDRVSGVS